MIRNKEVSVYTKLSNKYNIPYQVIEVICNHPFMFLSRKIADDEDETNIMFTHLGKFKIKNRYKHKQEKSNKNEHC